VTNGLLMNLHCFREPTQRAQARSRVSHDNHLNGNSDQMASFECLMRISQINSRKINEFNVCG
jgi:hypothetical protein